MSSGAMRFYFGPDQQHSASAHRVRYTAHQTRPSSTNGIYEGVPGFFIEPFECDTLYFSGEPSPTMLTSRRLPFTVLATIILFSICLIAQQPAAPPAPAEDY